MNAPTEVKILPADPDVIIAFAALLVSFIALIFTIFQFYIQRKHNQNSVRPIGQIVCGDKQETVFVHLANLGLGPMTVTKLSFKTNNGTVHNIEHCLTLNPRSYFHVTISEDNPQTILPNGHLKLFEQVFNHFGDPNKQQSRSLLCEMEIQAEYYDIYNSMYTVKRKLNWFGRYLNEEKHQD
jgi:hypothetical protein